MGFSSLDEKNTVKTWLENNIDAKIIRTAKTRPMIHFKTNSIKGMEVVYAIKNQNNFGIRYICSNPEFCVFSSYTPNDPLLENQTYIDQINLTEAWYYETGDSSVEVAIIDYGVEYDHPDLKDNYNIFDDYDHWDSDYYPKPANNSFGGNEHGTRCAGVFAAVMNNNKNISGVANVTLTSYRVGTHHPNGTAETDPCLWADAIDKAVAFGIDIISISLGWLAENIPDLYDACNDAKDAGVLIIAAAGNQGYDLDEEGDNVTDYDIYPAEYEKGEVNELKINMDCLKNCIL